MKFRSSRRPSLNQPAKSHAPRYQVLCMLTVGHTCSSMTWIARMQDGEWCDAKYFLGRAKAARDPPPSSFAYRLEGWPATAGCATCACGEGSRRILRVCSLEARLTLTTQSEAPPARWRREENRRGSLHAAGKKDAAVV